MRNKIVPLIIAILLPNLAWACAGGGSYTEKIIQYVLNWTTALLGISSVAVLIILSIALAFKKDRENKRSKWLTIFITVALISTCICFYMGMSGESDWFNTYFYVFIIVLFILIVILALKEDEKNKRLKWWIIFSGIVFSLNFLIILYLTLKNSTLCAGPGF